MRSLFLVFFVSSCGMTGSFCDLAEPLKVSQRSSAEYLLAHERQLVVDMNVHNRLLQQCK